MVPFLSSPLPSPASSFSNLFPSLSLSLSANESVAEVASKSELGGVLSGGREKSIAGCLVLRSDAFVIKTIPVFPKRWIPISGSLALQPQRGITRPSINRMFNQVSSDRSSLLLLFIVYFSSSDWDRLSIDEFEMEEELRPDFTCPYCYEDHDISSLCSHIEEEHAFESTAARRRRLRRFAIPSNQTLSLLGRDLREAHLQILLGNAGRRTNNNEESNIASDSFLSSLFMNFPTSEVEESSKPSTDDNAFLKTESDLPSFISGLNSSLTHEQKEQRRKQATVRATFVQDLLFSTLFDD
ncbi:hypothetical protein ZIOFF_053069 [Zingiber officinale]|uniref:Protein dehydration-induced 19 C-terminal domain-containing protein n=1 Tax=Zingiber officinale TaxID=94328 RepID=A0A8J5KMR9_ZINOF|nr:hypothetical protein ZIOFF_053069 [Zingiber officinale]